MALHIAAMPETTININSDGQIEIFQRSDQTDADMVCFPIELAEKIENEILRLARDHESQESSG